MHVFLNKSPVVNEKLTTNLKGRDDGAVTETVRSFFVSVNPDVGGVIQRV